MLSAGARAFLESSLNTPVEQIFGATGNPQPLTPLDYYRLLFQLGRTGFGSFSVFVYSFKVLSYAASGVLVVLAFTTPTRRVFVSGGLLCTFLLVLLPLHLLLTEANGEGVEVYFLPRFLAYLALTLPLIGFFVRPPRSTHTQEDGRRTGRDDNQT